MAKSGDESVVFRQLRDKAEAQLKAGTAPTTTNWTLGVDALRMLHSLSSNPETAQDALKLLHELQVHQVELDVQHEQIVANERLMEEDLSRYRALFEQAPAGYFLLNHEGVVVEGNLAAAALFGVAQEDLAGRHIDTLLTPDLQPQLQKLLQQVVQGGSKASSTVQPKPGSGGAAPMQFVASILSETECVLLICSVGTNVG